MDSFKHSTDILLIQNSISSTPEPAKLLIAYYQAVEGAIKTTHVNAAAWSSGTSTATYLSSECYSITLF